VNVRKTVGGGAFGRVSGAFGRSRRYTKKANRVNRMRLIGVTTGAASPPAGMPDVFATKVSSYPVNSSMGFNTQSTMVLCFPLDGL